MRIAIIKTGEFETFNEQDRGTDISLGDVLRTTPLLNLFSGTEVDWLTSPRALPLLARVPGLAHVDSEFQAFDFSSYDLVVNLERSEAALSAMERVRPQRRVGFVRGRSGPALLCSTGRDWTILQWKASLAARGQPFWQQWLFALLGREWRGERYLFNDLFDDRPVLETNDVGLNWKVGVKWPSKTLPFAEWERLAESMGRNLTVSWQEGFDDLNQYFRWISSCRVILTHDSLGMHLGIALRKKVVVFFGPTHESEVYLYSQGEKVFGAAGLEDRVRSLIAARSLGNVLGSNQTPA